jgi:type I restriction enzyme S subunit
MSFPRYPAYKSSGAEWLGEVPEHWNALPLRRLISKVSSGTSVNAIDEPASPGQAGVLKTSCVYTGEFRPEENKAILESELDRATCPVVAGSLVVSRMNTPDLVGAAGLVKHDDPLLFLPDRLWQVSFQDSDPQFMNYWCKSVSYRSQVQLACSGTSSSMQNLSQDHFFSFIAPLPSKTEQLVIARFLARETAKIDTLITEQQRLIELLQEKRQAVISHAVTKGLNPNAPMKDSGVEWLGEVPEHWELLELKRLCKEGSSITYGIVQAGPHQEQGVPYIRTSDMSGDKLLLETCQRTSPEIDEAYARSRVHEGDLVIAIRATVGKALEVPKELDGANLTQGTAKFSPGEKVSSDFIRFAFASSYCQAQIGSIAKGATFLEITLDALRRLTFAVPPKNEMNQIAHYLTERCVALDILAAQAEEACSLLKERRSALISAAVTGQIDVRGLLEAEAGQQ